MSKVVATIHNASPPNTAGSKRTSSSHSPASRLITWSAGHVSSHAIGHARVFSANVIDPEFNVPSSPPAVSHTCTNQSPAASTPSNAPANVPPVGKC